MKNLAHYMLIPLALVCFLVSGSIGRNLSEFRVANKMTAVGVIKNAPPLVVFTTVVLGGFRGLLADVLWLRASYLQEQGRFFELVQLSDWITKLEPRFPEVWTFHAWNMGYNISVLMPEQTDRWRWVNNGIKLLRDEALLYNPEEPLLYFELAFFFQFKLGENTDAMHLYYKKKWAEDMTTLLGGPRPDYQHLTPEQQKAMQAIWKLQPAIMQELETLYGPMDWRIPETHAVYWGYMGLLNSGKKDAINCDRVVFQSLAALFRKGKLTFDPTRDLYATTPDPGIIPGVIKAYEQAMAKYQKNESIAVAYNNFLKEATLTLYSMDQKEDSLKVFSRMTKIFPSPDTTEGLESFIKKNVSEPRHTQ